MKNKYNRAMVMRRAWKIAKKQAVMNFGIALKQSWNIEKTMPNLEGLYNMYYKGLVNYVKFKSATISKEDAEEIATDLIIKFYENLHTYNSERASIKTVLFTYANYGIIDHVRKQHSDRYVNMNDYVNEEGDEYFQVADSVNSNSLAENNELGNSINNSFNNLSAKNKAIAELYFRDGLQYNEIADVLQIPLGSVKGTIFRIREALQNELKAEYSQL